MAFLSLTDTMKKITRYWIRGPFLAAASLLLSGCDPVQTKSAQTGVAAVEAERSTNTGVADLNVTWVDGTEYTVTEPGRVSLGVYDEAGRLVRTLRRGEPTEPGTYSVEWDGLDRLGNAVAPGDFEWRMLSYPGIQAEYLMSFGTNTDWPAWKGTWVGDHMGPQALAVDAENDWLYVVAGMGEGPPTIRQLSRDGTREGWFKYQQQFGSIMYFHDVAYSDGMLYIMAYGGRIFSVATESGQIKGTFVDAMYPGDVRLLRHHDRETQENLSAMQMDADANYVVVSYRDRDAVRVFSREDASVVREIPIDRPEAITMTEDGWLLVSSRGKVGVINLEDGKGRLLFEDEALQNVRALSYDTVNKQVLAIARDQVIRYQLDTGERVRTYGREGGREFGPFEPGDFRRALDVAADGEGGFFVAEEHPRRVSRFAEGAERPSREWFGGVSWGAMFTVDPERPEIGYSMPNEHIGHFMRFELDYENQTWSPTHLHDITHLPRNWARGGRWQVKRFNDRMWLIFLGDVNPGIAPVVIEIDEGGDLFRPTSIMGRLWWHQFSGGSVGWFEEADAAHEERTGSRAKRQHANAFAWLDRNGDGRVQPAEEVTPRTGAPGWGHLDIDADWNLYVASGHPGTIGEDGRAAMWHRIPLREDADGVPAWDWADAEPVRAEVPAEFRAWNRSEATGLRLGPDGSVYQLWWSRLPGPRGEGRHSEGWPHNEIGSVRLFKWNPDGTFVWATGEQAADKGRERPGQIAQPRGILGVIEDRVLVHDRAGRVCAAWTDDGLVAGSMFDRHADDGLPREWLYHITGSVYPKRYLMGDDHIAAGLVGLHDGRFLWMTPGQESTPVYELNAIRAGVRQHGTITVSEPVAEALGEGTGLTARYYSDPEAAAPELERLDPEVWFGSRHVAVYSLAAPAFFEKDAWPVDSSTFRGVWQGRIEGAFDEPYRFIVQTSGRYRHDGIREGSKVRLWIDGELVIDHWDDMDRAGANVRTKTIRSGTLVELKPGDPVDLKLEFESNQVDRPHLHLIWESPSQERQHVPSRFLYP